MGLIENLFLLGTLSGGIAYCLNKVLVKRNNRLDSFLEKRKEEIENKNKEIDLLLKSQQVMLDEKIEEDSCLDALVTLRQENIELKKIIKELEMNNL